MRNIIRDYKLRIKICEALGIRSNQLDLDSLAQLTCIDITWKYWIDSLEGLEHAKNLKKLKFGNMGIKDYSAIQALENLEVLSLTAGETKDIAIFLKLPKLRVLEIEWLSVLRFPMINENKSRIPYLSLINTFFNKQDYTMRQRKLCEVLLFNGSKDIAKVSVDETPRALPFAINFLDQVEINEAISNKISNSSVPLQYLKELIQMPQVNGEDLISEYGSTKARKWLMEKQLKMR